MKTKENVNIYFLSTLLLTSTSLFCAQAQAQCNEVPTLKILVAACIYKNNITYSHLPPLLTTEINVLKKEKSKHIIESHLPEQLFRRLSKHKNQLIALHKQKSSLGVKEQCIDKTLKCLPKKLIGHFPFIYHCLCCLCCVSTSGMTLIGCFTHSGALPIFSSSAATLCTLIACISCEGSPCMNIYRECLQSYFDKTLAPPLMTMSENDNAISRPQSIIMNEDDISYQPMPQAYSNNNINNAIEFFYSSGDNTFDSDSSSSDQQDFFQNNNIYMDEN